MRGVTELHNCGCHRALVAAACFGVALVALLAGPAGPGTLADAQAAVERTAARRLVLTATASTLTPVAGRTVTLRVRARDRSGRPLRGVRVRIAWALPGRVARGARTTGRTGRVTFRRTFGAALAGKTVTVRVRAVLRGQVRRRSLRLAVTGGSAAGRLDPADRVYAGAFRLPGPSGTSSWDWSGDDLTYDPGGDPGGAADG